MPRPQRCRHCERSQADWQVYSEQGARRSRRKRKSKRSGNDEQIKAVFDAYELMPVVREVAAKEPGL